MPMPPITCPTCKRALDVNADVQGPWITCPRCLTSVATNKPDVWDVPSPESRAVTDQPPSAARPSCPNCGRDVERSWRFCPRCEEPLGGRRRGPRIPELERDVRRDVGTVQIVAMVLGALLIVGAVAFFLCGGMELVGSDFDSAITACVVLVGIVLAGLAAIAIGSRNKIVYGITGALGGLLVGAAAVLLIIAAIINSILTACKCK
jgi:hypothetical protein